MRKNIFLHLVLWAGKFMLVKRVISILSFVVLALPFLISCKKENITDNPQNPDKEKLIAKVKSWLDNQKKDLPVGDTAKIHSLKGSLDYNELRLERYKDLENFIVVPISNEFTSKNNQDKNPVNYLVLVLKNQDSIASGNIIQYISSNSQKVAPQNSFYKIFTYQNLDCSGQFTILSITDYFRYELKFENGKLKSVAEYTKKNTPNNGSGRVNECIDWYEQTWYVWSDGSMTLESEVYVFTTCDGDCAQARVANGRNFATNCYEGGGGGGIEYDACVSAAISSFQSEANGAQAVSQTKSFDFITIDELTRCKNPKWTILRGAGGWTLESQEQGVIKLIDQATNQWAWKSLTHGSISMEGSPLPTTSVEHNQGVGTSSFTPETAAATTVLFGGMSLNFNVTYRLVCNCPNVPLIGQFPPINRYYTSNAIWNSNPQ